MSSRGANVSSTNLAIHFTNIRTPGVRIEQSRHRKTTNKAVLGADDVDQVRTYMEPTMSWKS